MRSILELGLVGVAAAAVVAIVVVALIAPGGTAMSGSNTWLPPWVRVLGVVVLAALAAVHLWHVRATAGRERAWHVGHLVMALGMIEMFASTSQPIVATRVGQFVFAVAVLATLAYIGAVVARGERVGWLWPALAADLAAMVYMFAPTTSLAWLGGILVSWLVLQAAGWASGVLPARADLGGARGGIVAGTACGSSRRDVSVRVSLAAMDLGMAYMIVAMVLGMAHAPGMAPMPGMRGM